MVSQLGYEKMDLDRFYGEAQLFAVYVSQGRTSEVTETINKAFFDGGNFAPKSLKSLFSTDVPDYLNFKFNKSWPSYEVTIKKTKSSGAQLGIVQGIPLIGSCLAAIACVGHLFRMVCFYLELRDISKKFVAHSSFNGWEHEKLEIMVAAMAFTIEKNQLIASLLSIPPLVKPIVRLAQAILHQRQKGDQKDPNVAKT